MCACMQACVRQCVFIDFMCVKNVYFDGVPNILVTKASTHTSGVRRRVQTTKCIQFAPFLIWMEKIFTRKNSKFYDRNRKTQFYFNIFRCVQTRRLIYQFSFSSFPGWLSSTIEKSPNRHGTVVVQGAI